MKKATIFVFIILITITGFGLQKNTANKASEEREIAKSTDPLKKASLHIKFANERIRLIQGKVGIGKVGELNPLINEYRVNIDKAYGEIMKAQALGRDTSSSLNIMNQETSRHTKILNGVIGGVPEQARGAIRDTIEVSQRGRQKAMENFSNNRMNQNAIRNQKGMGNQQGMGNQKGIRNQKGMSEAGGAGKGKGSGKQKNKASSQQKKKVKKKK